MIPLRPHVVVVFSVIANLNLSCSRVPTEQTRSMSGIKYDRLGPYKMSQADYPRVAYGFVDRQKCVQADGVAKNSHWCISS